VVASSGGDVMLGTSIAERYTIVGRVGAGGMGTVYRAEQAPMNREVALKVLRRDLGRDPETAARFHREARTLSQLKHPNTVTIFDFGQTDDGLLYLAMELLEGEMLSSRIKRIGPMDVPLAIRIAAGVLRSLAEAHSRGIIHRDLKPDNIFLARVHGRPDEDEVVKVVDFGIAKIRDGERGLEPLQTQEGTVFGTPRYMSPEQAQGKSLDGRSDLYAVGVLLFHMLTGHPPFTDDDAVVVMAHHIKTVPPPVRQIAPGRPVPAALEKLVQRALEKDPIHRPQTAEAFLAALEGTAEEARALSVPPPPMDVTPEATVRPAPPRSRRAAWIGAAAVALLVVGLASLGPRFAPSAGAAGDPAAARALPASAAAPLMESPPPPSEQDQALPPSPSEQVLEALAPAPTEEDAGVAAVDPAPARNGRSRSTRGTSRSTRSTRGAHHGGPYHRWTD
jgi:serine/threonine-protein kinase